MKAVDINGKPVRTGSFVHNPFNDEPAGKIVKLGAVVSDVRWPDGRVTGELTNCLKRGPR